MKVTRIFLNRLVIWSDNVMVRIKDDSYSVIVNPGKVNIANYFENSAETSTRWQQEDRETT